MYLRKCVIKDGKVILDVKELEQWRDLLRKQLASRKTPLYGKYELINELLENV